MKKRTKISVLEIVAKNIRTTRIGKGMTQQQLAKLTGFRVQVISRIETFPQNLSLMNLEKLADALGCSIHELISGKPSEGISPSIKFKIKEAGKIIQELNSEIGDN